MLPVREHLRDQGEVHRVGQHHLGGLAKLRRLVLGKRGVHVCPAPGAVGVGRDLQLRDRRLARAPGGRPGSARGSRGNNRTTRPGGDQSRRGWVADEDVGVRVPADELGDPRTGLGTDLVQPVDEHVEPAEVDERLQELLLRGDAVQLALDRRDHAVRTGGSGEVDGRARRSGQELAEEERLPETRFTLEDDVAADPRDEVAHLVDAVTLGRAGMRIVILAVCPWAREVRVLHEALPERRQQPAAGERDVLQDEIDVEEPTHLAGPWAPEEERLDPGRARVCKQQQRPEAQVREQRGQGPLAIDGELRPELLLLQVRSAGARRLKVPSRWRPGRSRRRSRSAPARLGH